MTGEYIVWKAVVGLGVAIWRVHGVDVDVGMLVLGR